MLEVFDLLLKDLMDKNVLFGGKIIVFGGDFIQILPLYKTTKKKTSSMKAYSSLLFGLNSKNYNYLRI